MKRIHTMLVLPALLLLSSWSLPARAGSSVPLKGTAVTVVTYGNVNLGPPCYFEFINDGTGEATHLGRMAVHLDSTVCATEATLTAADGDQLWMDLVFVGDDPATSALFFNYAITGGTGRFVGATGSGSYTFYDTFPTELNTINGTIDFKKK